MALSMATFLTVSPPVQAQNVQGIVNNANNVINDVNQVAGDLGQFLGNGFGGIFDDITTFLSSLSDIFPALGTFVSGVETIIGGLSEEFLPEELSLPTVGTWNLGIPDIANLDEILTGRAGNDRFTIDDIVLDGGIGGDNNFSESTELLRSQAIALYAKGIGKSVLSEEGQTAATESVMQIVENYAGIAQSSAQIAQLDAATQGATTSFDRLGLQSEQRREAARQRQMAAMNDATLIAGMMEAQALAAKSLVLDSQMALDSLGERAAEAREEAADEFVRRAASQYLITAGGVPDEDDGSPGFNTGLFNFIISRTSATNDDVR